MRSTALAGAEQSVQPAGDDRDQRLAEAGEPLESPRARENSSSTTHRVDVVEVEVDVEVAAPPTESYVRDRVRALRGAHGGSPRQVYRRAMLVTRADFDAILNSVLEGEAEGSVRRPVAVLMAALGDLLADSATAVQVAVAGDASARFGYAAPSATEKLRAAPEEWVRRLSTSLDEEDVEGYLAQHVADELERQRLRNLARDLRRPT